MYDTLTHIDKQGRVRPELAMSWESETPLRWIFRLRPNVKFHNGEDLTAEAVIDSIAFLKSEEGSKFYTASEVLNIAEVEEIDPLTIAITTLKPDPILPRRANLLWVLPPLLLAESGIEHFSQEPVGTGSFRLADWGVTSGAAEFEAFPASWRAPTAIDKLTIFIMQESITRLQALRSGQVHVAEQMSVDLVSEAGDDNLLLYERVAPNVAGVAFRVIGNEESPVADQRVRQAMNLAIDRDLIVNQIYRGKAIAAGQGAAPMVNGHNPDVEPWPYDPERARQVLDAVGFDFSRPINIRIATGISGNDDLIYQIIAQNLRSIGINVDLRSIPYARWLQSFTNNDWEDADAFSLAWDNSAYFDAIRAETYTGCFKANPFFCAEETKPLFEAIEVEMDADVRRGLLQDLMAVLHDVAPAIWLVSGTEYIAASSDVANMVLTPRGPAYHLVSVRDR